jgi:hypothetical protein
VLHSLYVGWNQVSKMVTTVMVQAESTVLQTLPRNAMTSANAAGTPGVRTYLAYDGSRHHRVSAPIAPIHERAGLHQP